MRVPDLEQMIHDCEEERCKHCGRGKTAHIISFVAKGPYTVAMSLRCMSEKGYVISEVEYEPC